MHAAARASALTALLLSPAARAGEPAATALRLTWSAPAECPSGDDVTHEVQRILAGDATRRATARADVAQLGAERWEVRLVTDVDGVPGERTLEASSCTQLASATALILAWVLDPTRASGGEPPQPSVPPPSSSSQAGPVRAAFAIGGAADVGLLPRAGAAIEIAGGVLVGPVRLEAFGADWFAQDAVAANSEGTHIRLLEGGFQGCLRGRFGERIELGPCLGAGFVYATSDGFGEKTPFSGQTSTWGIAQALALAGFHLAGPIQARASLGAAVPLARPPFVVLGSQNTELVLHQPAPVCGRATLGVEVRFP
jgi:hypothetical protein